MNSAPESAELLARLEACSLYNFDSVEMVECKHALWNEIIAALRLAAKPDEDGMRETRIAKASALARRLCQLFDSGGESQRTVRARHASAIFQLLGSYETEQSQCDADPVCYLERCERLALSTTGHRKS